jgi:hypothetical protein
MALESIIVGGQTGVDTGAAMAALANEVKLRGWRPALNQEQCETGKIPPKIRECLTPLDYGGYMARTKANVLDCDAGLVVVENRLRPYQTPGTKRTIELLNTNGPYLVVDPTSPVEFVSMWLAHITPLFPGGFALMVGGPRASKWAKAEMAAFDLVSALLQKVKV